MTDLLNPDEPETVENTEKAQTLCQQQRQQLEGKADQRLDREFSQTRDLQGL
jgi:hypothetical protein